jgi:hypothetical protein
MRGGGGGGGGKRKRKRISSSLAFSTFSGTGKDLLKHILTRNSKNNYSFINI